MIKIGLSLLHITSPLIIEPHDRGRFVLLAHHFDCFLSAVQVEAVVLLLLLNLHIRLHAIRLLGFLLIIVSNLHPRQRQLLLWLLLLLLGLFALA